MPTAHDLLVVFEWASGSLKFSILVGFFSFFLWFDTFFQSKRILWFLSVLIFPWSAISFVIWVSHAEKLFTVPAWVLFMKNDFEAIPFTLRHQKITIFDRKIQNQRKNEKNPPEIENLRPPEAHSKTPWRPCAVGILKAGTFSDGIKPRNIVVSGQKSAVIVCYQTFFCRVEPARGRCQ